LSHFNNLFNNSNELLVQLKYIPIKGIDLVNMSKILSLCSGNIINLWLLSDRKTLVYIYSHFSNKIHEKVHKVILNEIYKINNIDIENIDSKTLIEEVNWDKFKKRKELFTKYKTWKSLLHMTFWEVLYLILYISNFTISQIYDKIHGLLTKGKNVKLRIHDYERHDEIYYNMKQNITILSREQTNKLILYCKKEKIDICDLIQLLCVAIVHKYDSYVNVYCKRHINKHTDIGEEYVHIMNLGPISMISPNMESVFMTYVRMFSRLRFWFLRKLSDKCTLPKNAIYINCDSLLWGKPPTLFEGSTLNTIGVVQFYIDNDQLICNLFGININGYYLVFSAMIQALKQYFDVLLV
jgi:hypothetical protein